MAIEIRNNFDTYFTFPGCGQTLDLGEVCQLQSPVGPAPVEVIGVEDTGFALKSLPGHPEGQDRTITFRFLAIGLDVDPNAKTMRVNAWGPVSAGSILGPINDVAVAGPAWQTFADNITSRFPANPPCGPGCV